MCAATTPLSPCSAAAVTHHLLITAYQLLSYDSKAT